MGQEEDAVKKAGHLEPGKLFFQIQALPLTSLDKSQNI